MAARPRRRAGLVVALVLLAALLVTGPAAPADPGTAGAEPAARADVPPGHDELGRAIDRFYRGFFLRRPDDGGFTQWYCLASKGRVDLATIAQSFVDSAEFAARYGRLDHPAFVDLAYRNVFARPPEPSGRAYWLGQLDGGLPPGWMMVHLTESSEFRARTAAARPPVVDPAVLAAETCGPTLLTWISRGLPAGFATAVAGHPAVSQHTTVHGDLIELVSTRDAGGARSTPRPADGPTRSTRSPSTRRATPPSGPDATATSSPASRRAG